MSGRDDSRAGHPHGDPTEMPADLAAVRADDALLDMLGSSDCMPGDVDGELARVLAAWRLEVHTDSARELVHTDTALAVISAARRPAGRRNPLFGRFAAAAAVMVIAFSTVGLLAKSAHPGDNLWPVAEVLFVEYARSVKAAAYVETELKQAQQALQEGKPELAKQKLDNIEPRLSEIAPAENKAGLTSRHQELEQKLPAGMPAPDLSPDSPNTGSPGQQPGPGVAPSPSNTGSAEPSSPPDPSEFFPPSPSQPFPSPSQPFPSDPSQSTNPEPSPSPAPQPSPSPAPQPSPPPTPDAESLRQIESNRPSPSRPDPGMSTEGNAGNFVRPPEPPRRPEPPEPPRPPG